MRTLSFFVLIYYKLDQCWLWMFREGVGRTLSTAKAELENIELDSIYYFGSDRGLLLLRLFYTINQLPLIRYKSTVHFVFTSFNTYRWDILLNEISSESHIVSLYLPFFLWRRLIVNVMDSYILFYCQFLS